MTIRTKPNPAATTFIDKVKLNSLINCKKPDTARIREMCDKALKLKGLDLCEAAELLAADSREQTSIILETASKVKEEIYGSRLVLFAPLYTGNYCTNNCLYCGFRRDNSQVSRSVLNSEQIAAEAKALLKQGHKRVLLLCGESEEQPLQYTLDAIDTIYSVKDGDNQVRRINVEIAPLEEYEFKELKKHKIGTYTCFQETYDPEIYADCHPDGPKADYRNRLYVMHRAMEAGIDDVGIGALLGLADYRFEVLAMLQHAEELELTYGCGPHTISVPRIEPADHAPLTKNIPSPVSDDEFRKLIAVIRVSLPYTGIILSTRESEALRNELFQYGVSQVSAGSRTSPGAYDKKGGETAQFSLGDHRSLDEVISRLIDDKYVPSFCTGCYRQGRVGNDFMDLAKPGLIKQYCLPNGLLSFAEYLIDYASDSVKQKGLKLIHDKIKNDIPAARQQKLLASLEEIKNGKRDLYS
jgi:2-iminoacetate synthase